MQVLLHARGAERDALVAALASRLPLRVDGAHSLPLEPRPDVVWLHAGASEEAPLPSDAQLGALRAYLEAGGRCLLTGRQALCLRQLADETELPEVETGVVQVAPGERRCLGVLARPGQPLFRRTAGGLILRQLRDGAALAQAVWGQGRRPASGRVLGVERTAQGADGERVVLVEHRVGLGRIVTLGAHLVFDDGEASGLWREARARFAGDLVDYLLDDVAAERERGWPGVGGVNVAAGALVELGRASDDPASELRAAPAEAPLQLVHPRGATLRGTPRAGATSLWLAPANALRDCQTTAWRDGVALPVAEVRARAGVDQVEITWSLPGDGCLVQTWRHFADGFAVRWHNQGTQPIELRCTGVVGLTLSAPYPEVATGPLEAVGDAASGGFDVTAPALGLRASWRSDAAPCHAALAPAADGRGAEFARHFALAPGAHLELLLGGALVGAVGAAPFVASLALVAEGHAGAKLATHLERWREFVQPLLGRRVLAAQAGLTTRDALLALPTVAWLGGEDVAADTLRALAQAQLPDGRIPSAVTPVGVALADAADSTALFVDAVARVVAWRDDAALRAELWPAVVRALEHLREADRDGDGVMDGALFGETFASAADGSSSAAGDLGLALCELRAMTAGATLARAQGDARIAQRCGERERFLTAAVQERALLADDTSAPAGATLFPLLLGFGSRELVAREALRLARQHAEARLAPALALQLAALEFRAGRADAAWQKLSAALEAPPTGSLAAHAALSGALIEGLLGLQLDEDGRLVLEPSLPGALDAFAFTGLRVRGHTVSGRISRDDDGAGLRVVVRAEPATPLELELAPCLLGPTELLEVRCGDAALDFAREDNAFGVRLRSRLELSGEVQVDYRCHTRLRLLAGGGDPLPELVVLQASETECTLEVVAHASRTRLPLAFPRGEPNEVTGAEFEVGRRPALWFDSDPVPGKHAVTLRFGPPV